MRGQIKHRSREGDGRGVIVKGDTTYAKVDLSGFESVHVYGLHVCFVCYEGYREKGVSWMGWRMETTVK